MNLVWNPSSLLRVCSGQSWKPGGPGMAICLNQSSACPWWRAEATNGRMLTYRTIEVAERARVRFEDRLAPHKVEIEQRIALVLEGLKTPTAPIDIDRSALGKFIDELLIAERGVAA